MNARRTRTSSSSLSSFQLLTVLLALGCGSDVAPDDLEQAVASAEAGPARSVLLEGIGDAENASFSDDGRLFVTGGENVYEITRREDGSHAAVPLYAGTCNFTGVVAHRGHLYASCVEGTELGNLKPHLLAAPLERRVELRIIHDYAENGLPNGMAFDDAGRLFVADFTPLSGKIVTVTLASPLVVAREEVWQRGGLLVNGLKVFGQSVYVTDMGSIRVIPIERSGRAGRPRTIATRLSVLDDLMVDADGIVVADFLGRKLAFYSHAGRLLRETPPLFDTPSSITRGRPPLVPEGSLVVTEKGALNELTSRDGNRVSLYVR